MVEASDQSRASFMLRLFRMHPRPALMPVKSSNPDGGDNGRPLRLQKLYDDAMACDKAHVAFRLPWNRVTVLKFA